MSVHSQAPPVASLLICIETDGKKLAPRSNEKKLWQDVIDGIFLTNIFRGNSEDIHDADYLFSLPV